MSFRSTPPLESQQTPMTKDSSTPEQIPGWLRDNEYIITGHPMPTFSYKRSFRLWRCLHMETMNIWTHLFGSIGFIGAGVGLCLYASDLPTNRLSNGDFFAFEMSITSSALCFGLSATFHTLRSHSYNIHHFWGRLDIFGICLLALGGGTSANYYAFYCNHKIQRIYWPINAFSALAAAFTLFNTGGGGSKMRTIRGGVFSLLATSAMIPIFHRMGSLGWTDACLQIGAQWLLAEGLLLFVGVGIFVCRFPEKWSPGDFDIWGHSHQLFHIFAVAATACHLRSLVTAFNYRQVHPAC
ncbi:HlyIII-domain-containing protein [Tothia fuscella]|uniref:HlyIII-domain-containing protein n=1 Tax=Tothia fuscella TaxID=1048955 RepID=A0A9P4TU17_9PEZI|nr:HlyIII-domain-containing protein [Tothia fuscella]